MIIFELNTKETQKIFKEIKKFFTAAKSWKINTTVELTVIDGLVQVVGSGFVREIKALTTGSCKLVVPVIHWFELFQSTTTPMIKIVVTDGEAMVGRVTVRVRTTFFEADQILRSIQLPANPKAIDYLKLEYQGYSKDELQFNLVAGKVEWAKKELDECIRLAAINLNPFRFSKAEVKTMVLNRLREREKIDFKL
ncbi:hypothetical protein [Algoriphagus antarcticus]|uniref:Uncharacterized protein n=1 Tax=Algoriphagus antarcticus TaxID=238540 RepID=A0A3E0D6H2_9BACT|nr:hypothetical protein [Algoriphagus antarcticus]REG77531.1 hypothetical protein C8N25_1423 [Algoriphagus antarcticus]